VPNRLVVIGLIVLIILLAIPLGIGMAVGMCPDCSVPGAPGALVMCATFFLALVLLASIFATELWFPGVSALALGVVRTTEPPPRFL